MPQNLGMPNKTERHFRTGEILGAPKGHRIPAQGRALVLEVPILSAF